MATEIEIKLKVDSLDPIRERLRELGATPRGERFEVNAFFDANGTLKLKGEGLRLRSMRDAMTGETRSVITFKGPATGAAVRSREEIEFNVGDFDAASTLLARLGYSPTLAFEKRRETWALDGCLIELDTLPRLGTFVEIEGEDVGVIESIRPRLGLDAHDVVERGYASMVGALFAREPELAPLLRFSMSS